MAVEGRLTNFLNRRKWIIPVLFGMMCALLVADIVIIELGNVTALVPEFAFSIGGELCAMFVAIMMTLSIIPTYKRQSGYSRIFVTLLTIGCFSLFLDTLQMIVDKNPDLVWANKIISIFVFGNSAFYMYFFWLYASYALRSEGKTIATLNTIALVLLFISYLLSYVNLFYPIYFTVDELGVYARNRDTWWICQIFNVYIIIAIIIALILSKEKIKKKIVIMAFIGLPIFAVGAGGYNYGLSLQYTAMMVSLVLIYSFIFSGNERSLYSKNKELGLATNIQKHMLPSIFPAFPELQEFDIYASMRAAKEVGGDFYDFFLIDDDHLGLVIADVSDKGIPAALFMMASKIMVQNYAMVDKSPASVLHTVNKQICRNNQDGMFVTVWLGILNLKTGVLTASNAGHEKPVIKKPDGNFEIYNDKHNFVIGFDADAPYSEYKIKLEPGSKLFLYTDGVPEAKGPDGRFGMERMLATLNHYRDATPESILKGMSFDVDTYVGNSEQFDDITMLCVEYKGKKKTNAKTYRYQAVVENVDAMLSPILDDLEIANVDSKLLYKMRLVLEELLTNVCFYAYAPDFGDVEITYEIIENPKSITITIIDEGKAFNPLESEEPDLEAKAEDRKIGGLGLFIVKKTMDEVNYSRRDDKNILVIKKNL